MAGSRAQVTIAGRVVDVKEIREVGKDKKSVLNFTVIEDFGSYDRESNKWEKKASKTYQLVAWEDRAERLSETLHPGMDIIALCDHDVDPRVDKDGNVVTDEYDNPLTWEKYNVIYCGPDVRWASFKYVDEDRNKKAEENLEKMRKRHEKFESKFGSNKSSSSRKSDSSKKPSKPENDDFDVSDNDDEEDWDF